jgi:hypothetical protein
MKSISSYFQKETRVKEKYTHKIPKTTEEFSETTVENKLYKYYPREFMFISFDKLFNEVSGILQENYSRRTCVCSDVEDLNKLTSVYSSLNKSEWTPIIKYIKENLEQKFNKRIDYGLVQYYDCGKSGISWHNDKEALNTFVFVVSFGTSRKFSIRDINSKQIVDNIVFIHGDTLWMQDGFQQQFEHSIPTENKIKEPRLSLTFRQFE